MDKRISSQPTIFTDHSALSDGLFTDKEHAIISCFCDHTQLFPALRMLTTPTVRQFPTVPPHFANTPYRFSETTPQFSLSPAEGEASSRIDDT